MNKLLDSFLDLIFPPRCEVCRKGSKEVLCAECFGRIKFMKPNLGIHSVSAYEGVIKSAIHRFKFKKRKKLAEPLGILMVRYLSRNPLLNIEEMEAIVPVPLHAGRLRKRGFNQAELLARIVSKYFGTSVLSVLERVRETKAQFDLAREERFKNINRAFKLLHPAKVYNKRILLLDDIYTTGATISECSRVLKSAGARRVEILTLSRALEA